MSPLWPFGSPRDRTKQASTLPLLPLPLPHKLHTPYQIYTAIPAPGAIVVLHFTLLAIAALTQYLPSAILNHSLYLPPYSPTRSPLRLLYTTAIPLAPPGPIDRQTRYPETPLRKHMTAVLRPSRSLQASLFLSLKSRSSTALKTTIL